jgi:hypothetical protein
MYLLTPTLTLVSWTSERAGFAAEHSRNTSNPSNAYCNTKKPSPYLQHPKKHPI